MRINILKINMRKLAFIIFILNFTIAYSQNENYKELLRALPYITNFKNLPDDTSLYPECNGIDCSYPKMPIYYTYQSAYPFIKGYALVQYHGKYGVIDNSRRFIIEPFFSNIKFIDNCIKFDDKTAFSFDTGRINNCDEINCPFPVIEVSIKKNENGKYQLIDRKEKNLLKTPLDSIDNFCYGEIGISAHYSRFYIIKKDNKWGVLDSGDNYKQIIGFKYLDAKFIGSNYLALKSNLNYWYYYANREGKLKFILRSKILCEKYYCYDKNAIGVYIKEGEIQYNVHEWKIF